MSLSIIVYFCAFFGNRSVLSLVLDYLFCEVVPSLAESGQIVLESACQ